MKSMLRNFVIEGVACQPPSSLRRLQATPPLQTSLVKTEYGPEISIFGLKLIMKSGLEKIFLKFLHAQAVF